MDDVVKMLLVLVIILETIYCTVQCMKFKSDSERRQRAVRAAERDTESQTTQDTVV